MKPRDPEVRGGDEAQYHVRVLDRAIAILAELARGEEGCVELSQKLHLHKSTVHRLLAVLEAAGFVERDGAHGKFRLGSRLFDLGMAASSRLSLFERTKPSVAQLVKETSETAHLGVLRQGNVVSLLSAESPHVVRMPATVGRRTPLHCVSQGKAILAFLPPQEIHQLLAHYKFTPYTHNTIVTKAQFLAELALVRQRGYAVDNEEFEEGLRCIAAPVRDSCGAVVAAIGIAGPAFRLTGARLPALAHTVVRIAAHTAPL